MKYAGFWPRLGAGLVDAIILGPIAWATYYLVYSWSWSAAIVFELPIATAFAVYSILFIGLKGQTPGKMAVGIKVIPIDGSPIGLKHGLFRHFVDLVFSLISSSATITALLLIDPDVFSGLDFSGKIRLLAEHTSTLHNLAENLFIVWIFSELVVLLLNQKKRALHDFIAGTVVVHIK